MPHDPVEREAQDDHDLLTHSEAGARLAEEIAATQAALDDLRTASGGSAEEAAGGAAEATLRRLEALREAARRNARTLRAHQGGAGFLTYRGPGSTLAED